MEVKVRSDFMLPQKTKEKLYRISVESKRTMTSILLESLERYFEDYDNKK